MNEFPFDLLRINQLPRIFCCISFCSMHMVIIHLLPLAIQIALGLSKEHLLCFSFFFSNKVKKHEQIASNHLPRDILQQECSSGSLELVLRWNVIENTPCVLYNVTLHANKMKKKLFCFTMNQSNCVIVNVLFYLVWLWKKPLRLKHDKHELYAQQIILHPLHRLHLHNVHKENKNPLQKLSLRSLSLIIPPTK